MRSRIVALLALAALVLCAAPAAAKPRAAKRIKIFDSCRTLVDYATRHIPPPQAPPRPGPIAPEQRSDAPPNEAAGGGQDDSSQTNVQEAGVDEPDTVKTDGQTIFALAAGTIHTIDARAEPARLLGTLSLGEHGGDSMLLSGNRLLVLGYGPLGARMTEVDVSNPAKPSVVKTEDVDGYIVDARL